MSIFDKMKSRDRGIAFTVIKELQEQYQTENVPMFYYFAHMRDRKVQTKQARTAQHGLGCYVEEYHINTTRMRTDPVALAGNPDTPAETLVDISRMRKMETMLDLSRNPNAPAEALEILAHRYSEMEVKEQVASHLNTSPSTLEYLANDDFWEVRKKVSDNPNTPTRVLISLCEHEKTGIPANIAMNPLMRAEILAHIPHLKVNKDLNMKIIAVENPALPLTSLEELMVDSDVRIRDAAFKQRVKIAVDSNEYPGYPVEWVEELLTAQKGAA